MCSKSTFLFNILNIIRFFWNFKGMEHNPGLTEEQDVSHYIERDLLKHKEPPYKIIRDEIVGR